MKVYDYNQEFGGNYYQVSQAQYISVFSALISRAPTRLGSGRELQSVAYASNLISYIGIP